MNIHSPKKVIVTFLETTDEDLSAEELHCLAEKGGAFDYLNNIEEDLYSDQDLKVKY